jgi:hypothetical protein
MSATASGLARVSRFYEAPIGKKVVMAVTGLILVGFVLGHMAGNLQIYLPPGEDGVYAIDKYGALLHASQELLWLARIVLLGSVGLHIWSAIQLASAANAARPVRYVKQSNLNSSYASRTMYWSGPIVDMKLVNPANKRKYTSSWWDRAGRRLGGGHAGRTGLQRQVLLLPDIRRAARTASPRRAASTPPRITRTTATASTASSTTRSRAATSGPARPTSTGWRRSQRQHHRPVRGAGRAVRPRVRRHCSPTAPSAARRSRARSTPAARRPAAAAGRLSGAGRGRSGSGRWRCSAHRDARSGRRRRQARGIVTRDLVTGEIESHAADAVVLGTGGYGNVFYLSTNAQGLQRHRHLAGLQARRAASPIPASPRSTPPASRSAATISRS